MKIGCHPLLFAVVLIVLAAVAAVATAQDVGSPPVGCLYRWEMVLNGPWEDGSAVWSVHLQDTYTAEDGSQVGGRTYFEIFADAETDTFDVRVHNLTATNCRDEALSVVGDTMDIIIGIEEYPDEAPTDRGLKSYWEYISQYHNWQYLPVKQYLPVVIAGWLTGPGAL